MKHNLGNVFVVVFGALAIASPIGAIESLLILGSSSQIAQAESTVLMLLTVVAIAYLVLNGITNYISNHKKVFLIETVLMLLGVASFTFNMITFVRM